MFLGFALLHLTGHMGPLLWVKQLFYGACSLLEPLDINRPSINVSLYAVL